MIDMILSNAVVNRVFKNDIKFVENLGHKTYLQDDDEIGVIIHLCDEDVTEELMGAMQIACEFTYFTHGEKKVNMYILAENCRIHVNEYTMPSQAVFSIKMAVAQ